MALLRDLVRTRPCVPVPPAGFRQRLCLACPALDVDAFEIVAPRKNNEYSACRHYGYCIAAIFSYRPAISFVFSNASVAQPLVEMCWA